MDVFVFNVDHESRECGVGKEKRDERLVVGERAVFIR